jgi:gliding motility-associated-like protein
MEIENVNCTGTVLGSARAQISGGITPYDFNWNNGETTDTITDLAPDIYVLTVYDKNLCGITDTAVIVQNTEVQVEIQVVDSISCNQLSDGELQAVATDGIGPYSYEWQNGGPSTQLYTNIGEGTYSVIVTDDEGCVGNQSITINDPEPLKAEFTVTNARCFSYSDGIVSLGAQGGTEAYQYYWANSLVNGNEVGNIVAGNYTLRILDAENCETDTMVTVAQPEKLIISLDEQYTKYPFCPDWQNGVLAVRVSGGTRNYTYKWTGYTEESDSLLSDIKEDSYHISITDAQNCEADTIFRLIALNNNCLGIPTAFTPNYDFANETWEIRYMKEEGGEASFQEIYPNGVIQVYDRLGNLVYRCTGGCLADWNGEDLKGRRLPVDTYYYIIELNTGDGEAPLKGIVTIIR